VHIELFRDLQCGIRSDKASRGFLTGEESAGSDEVEVYSFGVGDGLDVNFEAVVDWKGWLGS
jgi:hypothetical protein